MSAISLDALHADGLISFDDGSDPWSDLADVMAERADADRAAHAAEADQSTRDDGFIYHGRLPSEDVDAFNPSIVSHRTPGPLDDMPAWMERKHGGDPVGAGLPPFSWEVLR